MSDKDDLLKELDIEYKKLIEQNGLKTSKEDYEKIYGLKDAISKEGFIPSSLSFYLAQRASEFLFAWYNYMHTLIMPQPGSILQMEESSFISEEVKKSISNEMRKILVVVRKTNLAFSLKDEELAIKSIDNATILWNTTTKITVSELLKIISESWELDEKEEAKSSYSY
jgi:hypothetical protein